MAESSLRDLQTAAFLQCAHMSFPQAICTCGERHLPLSFFFYKVSGPVGWRTHSTTLCNYNYLLKALSLNTVTLVVRFLTWILEGHHSILCKAHTDFGHHNLISKRSLSGSQRNFWKTNVLSHNHNFRRAYILKIKQDKVCYF